jgi:small basic protein
MVLPLVIDSTGNGMGYVFFLSMNIFAPAIFLLQFTGLGAYLQTNFALVVLIVSLFLNPLIGSVLFVGLFSGLPRLFRAVSNSIRYDLSRKGDGER